MGRHSEEGRGAARSRRWAEEAWRCGEWATAAERCASRAAKRRWVPRKRRPKASTEGRRTKAAMAPGEVDGGQLAAEEDRQVAEVERVAETGRAAAALKMSVADGEGAPGPAAASELAAEAAQIAAGVEPTTPQKEEEEDLACEERE